jgi:cytochrome c oxidase subunit 4
MNATAPPSPPAKAREQERKDPGSHITPVWHYLAVLATLLALLTISAISALIPLGYWNTIVNLAISVIKTLLVMLFFMHETEARTLTRTTSALGFVWLAILIGIMLTDFLGRAIVPAPW